MLMVFAVGVLGVKACGRTHQQDLRNFCVAWVQQRVPILQQRRPPPDEEGLQQAERRSQLVRAAKSSCIRSRPRTCKAPICIAKRYYLSLAFVLRVSIHFPLHRAQVERSLVGRLSSAALLQHEDLLLLVNLTNCKNVVVGVKPARSLCSLQEENALEHSWRRPAAALP